jgi:hypothetical protein
MLRRNLRSDFVGGAYVFPGGAVDDDDAVATNWSWDSTTSRHRSDSNSSEGGSSFYVACLTRTLRRGGTVDRLRRTRARSRSRPDDVARLAAKRRALNAGELDFLAIMKRRDFVSIFGTRVPRPLDHPVGSTAALRHPVLRGLAPECQVATHDAGETVADTWIRPRDALAAHRRGEFEMIRPRFTTSRRSSTLSAHARCSNYARSLKPIVCVEPRIIERDGVSLREPR